MKKVRFRRNVSISIAGLVAFLGAVPLATSGFGIDSANWWAYPLLLILLIPLGAAVWGWRSGTDADAAGVHVRSVLHSRLIAWSDITEFQQAGRGVQAVLASGEPVELPAVGRDDLPRLIAASGTELVAGEHDAAPEEDTAEAEGPAETEEPAAR